MMRLVTRYRHLRREEDEWSMRRIDAEESFGMDSAPERDALERATDYAVEADMVEEMLGAQPR